MRIGEYKEALKVLQQTLASQSRLNVTHPRTLKTTASVLFILHDQGEFKRVVELAKVTLAAQEEFAGERNPSTINVINTIANCLSQLRKWDEAVSWWIRAVSIAECLVERNPSLILCRTRLAEALFQSQRFDDASAILAANIAGVSDGDNCPSVLELLADVALNKEAYRKKAAALCERILAHEEYDLGEWRIEKINYLLIIIEIFTRIDDESDAALKLPCRLYTKFKQATRFGQSHPLTTTIANKIGLFYYKRKIYGKALCWFESALLLDCYRPWPNSCEIDRNILGYEYNKAATLESLGLYEEALLKLHEISCKLWENGFPDNIQYAHWKATLEQNIVKSIANVLGLQGKAEEARDYRAEYNKNAELRRCFQGIYSSEGDVADADAHGEDNMTIEEVQQYLLNYKI
ncbi:hypothetical protein ABW19_dt0203132 [Dactylella cylindrospora]|nr:hypothetical protein ABW19_dt0203132 [Dactylella cylindrospora]